jgi:hypothetical protein
MSSPDLVPASPLSSIDEAPIPVHLDLTVDELDDDILPLANDDAVVEIADPASGKRERGRVSSTVWDFFTSDANPHHAKSAMCKHCKVLVNHHKKSEPAKVHLHKCSSKGAGIGKEDEIERESKQFSVRAKGGGIRNPPVLTSLND